MGAGHEGGGSARFSAESGAIEPRLSVEPDYSDAYPGCRLAFLRVGNANGENPDLKEVVWQTADGPISFFSLDETGSNSAVNAKKITNSPLVVGSPTIGSTAGAVPRSYLSPSNGQLVLDGKGTSNSGDVQAKTEKSVEKSGNATGVCFSVEAPLRDALVERMRGAGIDVVTDEAEGHVCWMPTVNVKQNLRAAT